MKNISLACIIMAMLFSINISAQTTSTLKGTVSDSENNPVSFAHVLINPINKAAVTDEKGSFAFTDIPFGKYHIIASSVGQKSKEIEVSVSSAEVIGIDIRMQNTAKLSEVEAFGNRYEKPDKIEVLTRLPLKPYEQIQSISIIGSKVIEDQGALTISDASKNVPGLYTFATYGNKRESMSSRGFRGIPILKNGVRVHSDFRGVGILTDMQGVDNIQVLKGSAAITQGIATDLGSPGGVINLVTKTPVFVSGGEASLRVGSYGQVRPAFDLYGPIDQGQKVAFRINGALERSNGFRDMVQSERFYINPSVAWKVDDKTEVILEMDYLDDSRTPDLGTVNLGENDDNVIYDLPYNRFLGFKSDKANTKNTTYAMRVNRSITDKLSVRGAFYKSSLELDDKGAGLGKVVESAGNPLYNQHQRNYATSTRNDDNSVFQLDLVGNGVQTGKIKHVFQVGFDYRTSTFSTTSRSAGVVDTIDVFAPNMNILPDVELGAASESGAKTKTLGMTAQDVISWNKWFKTFIGIRYSSTQTIAEVNNTTSTALNPLAGIILNPVKNVNVFASYTNSSYPRTAARLGASGEELGNKRFDQLEAGIKTSWMGDRLRFNLTFFKINNTDINLPVYDASWSTILYYEKGGDDQRQGIEVELTGRVLKNLEIIAGYSYIDAQYKEHNSFVYGSAPLNTLKHTFNAYANYSFRHKLDGLSIGAGAYYTGKRPVNDWSSGAITHEGIVPNQKPFDVDAYTLVNVQIGYQINQHWGVRVLLNNVFDEIGYNTYRTKYINQTDPRSIAGVLTYNF